MAILNQTSKRFNTENQNSLWVILLNLVHTGNLQFLAIFYNLAANEYGFLPKNSKLWMNTPK